MIDRCFTRERVRFVPWAPLVSTCFLAVGCVHLHADQGGLTALQVSKLRSVRSVSVSPDGRFIAYVASIPRQPMKDDDGPSWAELHVFDEEAGSRPFITGPINVSGLAWTPDGKDICFLAKRGKDKHRSLYRIPIDGGEARMVLEHPADVKSYAWSPDARRVAFLATEKEDKDRTQRKKKGFKQQIYEEDRKPVRVWIADVDGDESEPRPLDLPGSASELSWAPAGSRLAVALAPTPHIDDHYMYRRVHIVDADSGRIVTRLENPGKLGHVAWSPDGKHLALISGETLHDPSAGRLMVVPSEGGRLRDVLPDYLGQVSAIAWQDSETVMFLGDQGVWTTFGEVRIDGTGHKTHVPTGGTVLLSLSVSRNGQRAAFVGQTPQHPSELFAMRHGDKGPRKLTESNPWLSDVRLAPQEVITYRARDGLELQGLLIRPLDAKPGTRYPLILSVHGGPEGHRRNGWLTRYASPGQMAAARGFAVFYPNYRGSTGRGVEFSKLGQADPAGKEFDDLVDAVDYLVEIGLADPERIGVTGGSYGGYATAWCSTRYSDRFAVGVMFVGISDKVSKTGTTDIPNEEFLVHSRKRPWNNWQFFLERSPVVHVDKARTPLLILHGKDDPRVNVGQSMEMYRHLKLHGKAPVRLVLYPGEGHGNRKAAAQYDYSLRMLRWFEHYLTGPGGDPPDYDLDYGLDEPDNDQENEDADSD